MDASALATRIASNPQFRASALADPDRLLHHWAIDEPVLVAAARAFAVLDLSGPVRREGHAALFALLAAAH